MIQFLIEPFQYGFMSQAMLVGGITAVMCAVLSCYVVLKGWSLMGDAISHAVLPGVVIAYSFNLPLLLGAFTAGMFCSISAGLIQSHSRIKQDTVMGVVFTGMFAFGLVLFSRTPSHLHLDHILLGNILGVLPAQRVQVYTIGCAIIALILVLRKNLLLVCFDFSQAKIIGIAASAYHYLLLSCLALGIVMALQAVGIILVVAMLITPGSIAYLWTNRFDQMLVIAMGSALVATLFGIFISYHADASTSACIVLTQALFFLVSLKIAPHRH